MAKLRAKCAEHNDPDGLLYEQLRTLLTIEDQHSNLLRRAKLYKELDKSLQTMAFNNIREARVFALNRRLNENQIKLLAPHLTEEEQKHLEWENQQIETSLHTYSYLEMDQIDIEELSV